MANKKIIFIVTAATAKAKEGFKKLDTKIQGMNKSVMKLGQAYGALTIGAVAAGVAIGKVWNFGKQGASVKQLTQSFERMNDEIFMTPNLLNDMSKAVKGTIRESELMAGLMTLTAGTSRQLSQALAESTPELLKIAKAANKLNPTLGTTAMQYDSISKGIKRASPMVLDNLGIIISIEEANQNYAKSLGKTTKEMTKADQQMAILNATLEKGGIVVRQVGGSVDALGDAYARTEGAMGNVFDKYTSFLDTVFTPLLFTLDAIIKGSKELAKAMDELFSDGTATGKLPNWREWANDIIKVEPIVTNFMKLQIKHQAALNAEYEKWNFLSNKARPYDITKGLGAAGQQRGAGYMTEGTQFFEKRMKEMKGVTQDPKGAGADIGVDFSGAFLNSFMDATLMMDAALTNVFINAFDTGNRLLDGFLGSFSSSLIGELLSFLPGGGILGSIFGSSTSVNDALITKKGDVVKFNPNDNIMAFQGSAPTVGGTYYFDMGNVVLKAVESTTGAAGKKRLRLQR